MKVPFFLPLVALVVLAGHVVRGAEADEAVAPKETIRLFNGSDLSGWTTWLVDTGREDPRGVYAVRDGAIRISGDGFGYLSTDRAYKDYRLVVEVKWGQKNYRTREGMARDSGIFLHSVGPEGNSYDCGWGSPDRNTDADVSGGAYKAAIECQVMEGGFGDVLLIHGRYADGRHVPVSVTGHIGDREVEGDYARYQFNPAAGERTLDVGAIAWLEKDMAWQDRPGFRGRDDVESPPGEWTRVECVCAGDRITVFVNGERVNEVYDAFPSAGKILLQCEGSEVFYRRLELHPLRTGQVGSWGDQGDGTYRNPILNADFPDVDVEQLGDTYYMISSKQHMSPGMVILESQDMVNWRTIGHVWDKLSWDPKYDWDRMDGYGFGVWAGDLAWHDGRWYCYQIDTTNGLYMSSAEDIRGPWTEPHRMLEKTRWTDPAVCWDDVAKQAYLVCNFGKGPGGNQIKLFKMSWDGRELLDEGTVIHRGLGAEAAKIYRIDGRWYIFLAQWFRPDPRRPSDEASSGDRKQLVLRSTTESIYGPYESKVVYERGNGVVRSCSQGALMKAPDGSWWYTHQLIQNIPAPFQGRPQMLQPVRWADGWPTIGEDVDGDGIGEPVLHHAKPIQGRPICAPPTDDEFDADARSPQWEWNHSPRDGRWSLVERPGWLRLKASKPVGPGGFWGACNTISQRLMGTGKGQATAKLDLAGMKPGQRAGFVRFGGVYHLLGIHVEGDGTRRLFLDANAERAPGETVDADVIWIRTTNEGDQARFAWSPDGVMFRDVGPVFTVKFGKWTGDRLGFFCWNDETDDPARAGHVDVDWFHYDYDGPKRSGVRSSGIERETD